MAVVIDRGIELHARTFRRTDRGRGRGRRRSGRSGQGSAQSGAFPSEESEEKVSE